MRNARRLRRLRRFLPYPLIGAALFWLSPQAPFGSHAADRMLDALGLLVAFAGEGLRFWTWGTNAVAGLFSLRADGPYALARHPLYAGNFLIACGMLLIYNNPIAYLIGIPSFAALYAVIARREEHQLLGTPDLGRAYAAYVRAVPNRFLPRLDRWAAARRPAHPFAWAYAGRKEGESVIGILLGWIALDLFEEEVVWQGAGRDAVLLGLQLALLALIAVAAPALYLTKKPSAAPPPA